MLGFQAEGFPDTYDRFFKLYNAKPFDVFKYFNLTAIQSAVDAIRNGAGRNVSQQLQFEAQMALHVLGLNQYVTEQKIKHCESKFNSIMKRWLKENELDKNKGIKHRLEQMILWQCGQKAHYEKTFRQLYEQLRTQYSKEYKAYAKLMNELLEISEVEDVMEKSKSQPSILTVRKQVMAEGLLKSGGTFLIVLLFEKVIVHDIKQKYGITEKKTVYLLWQVYKLFQFLEQGNDNFIETEIRYYSRLKKQEHNIKAIMKLESLLLGDSLDEKSIDELIAILG